MHKLSPGSCIGIVAPASRPSLNTVTQTLAMLHKRGYRTRLLGFDDAHLARNRAGDILRAARIVEGFADPSIDALLCLRGGYGSGRIVDLIDYSVIARHPKPFVGYSDITYLLFAFFHRASLPSLHGPSGADLVCSRNTQSVETFFEILSGCRSSYLLAAEDCETIHAGEVRGPLLGGNLSILSTMMGTADARIPAGSILFFEDVDEYLYQQDRAITHLRRCGLFEQAAGIIVGKSPLKDAQARNSLGHSFRAMIEDRLSDLSIPIVCGFPCGHTSDQLTLPFGVMADLKVCASGTRLDFANPFAAS